MKGFEAVIIFANYSYNLDIGICLIFSYSADLLFFLIFFSSDTVRRFFKNGIVKCKEKVIKKALHYDNILDKSEK
jgi:hypothetical protein